MYKIILSLLLAACVTQTVSAQKFSERKRLGSDFNTDADELQPVFTPDGKTLYFVRGLYSENTGGKEGGQDIWVSHIAKKNVWEKPKAMPSPINNYQDNAIFHVSAGGRMLYLDNRYSPKPKLMAPGVSYSMNFAGKWSVPKVMKVEGFSPHAGYSGYCMGADESVLFISCPKVIAVKGAPGSHISASSKHFNPVQANNEDLYVAFKKDTGGYTIPFSLGTVVNTAGIEFAPWMDEDGITLYFSSTGHKGLGAADIFRTKRLDSTYRHWSVPENLGPNVNSTGFDAYFRIAPNRQYALYSSDSGSTKGLCDLFRVTLSDADEIAALERKLDSLVTVKALANNIPLKNDSARQAFRQSLSHFTPEKAAVPVPDILHDCPDTAFVKSLREEVSRLRAENLRLMKEHVPGEKSDEEKVLEKRPENERKVYSEHLYKAFPNVKGNFRILFPFNKWDLNKASEKTMTGLLEYLKLRPHANLFVYGHTDSIGSADVNERISNLRAETIKSWLESSGIEADRIRTIGKGMQNPAAANKTAEGRRRNRRTEVEIREK
ncbi:MAG: OmpA family protein [Bacteroidota bacterium]